MHTSVRDRLIAKGVVLTVVFCLTARPALNAADGVSAGAGKPRSLAEELFTYASGLSRSLSDRASEDRSLTDYRRALDAYDQVIRLNTDNFYSTESLAKSAELLREMADESNDSALYQQAIEAYRRVISEHPRSAFVGDALISIAQIFEENLQDLEGAASAYRELIDHFPNSVMAREAEAVLARFDAQLKRRPVDVLIPDSTARETSTAGPAALMNNALLNNVRNFGGPDYARVVLDLSGGVTHSARRDGNIISITLTGATVARPLYGRRFIVADGSLLQRITVSQVETGAIRVDVRVDSLGDYSIAGLSEPERLILDVYGVTSANELRARERAIVPSEHRTVEREPRANPEAPRTVRTPGGSIGGQPLYSLPEISEPIPSAPPPDAASAAPAGPAAAAAGALAGKVDARAAESPIKRIVIDPGHGGHDTGTISASGLREKDLVLDVARRLRAYVKKSYPDIEVILTRDADRFIALEERTAIANSRRADLFISIHANASQSRAASGVETFFVSPDRAKSLDAKLAKENGAAAEKQAQPAEAAQTADKPEKPQPVYASVTVGNRVAESRELARYIQSGLVRGIGAASPKTAMNRGVKHAAFAVLLGAAMPSVLAEVSFLSNARDEALLQTSQFRERVAASMFAGLNAFLKRNRPAEKKAG
jgi:N-acetylmuramoyl-L-alanine amidase